MRELIERLDKATGPDRLLDANVHFYTVGFKVEDWDDTSDFSCYGRGGWTLNRADRIHLNFIKVPHYTASIDAAVALAERVLPGWWCNILQRGSGWEATLHLHRSSRADSGPHVVVVGHMDSKLPYSPNGAIALCIAILRAAEESAG